MNIAIRPKRLNNQITHRIVIHYNASQHTTTHRNLPQYIATRRNASHNQSESTTIQPKQNAGVPPAFRRRDASKQQKKGDTEIRKLPDAYLSASYVGPNPILFIGGRGIA